MTIAIDEPASGSASGPAPAGARLTIVVVIAGILVYPLALIGARLAGQAAVTAQDAGLRAAGWAGVGAFLALAFALPLMGYVLARASQGLPDTARAVFQRRTAHLAFATPSLYVAAGAYFGLLKLSRHELVVWAALWLAVAALLFVRLPAKDRAAPAPQARPRLRTVHGMVAAGLILIFLGAHLANHLSALLGSDVQRAVMHALRLWYRSPFVQPVLVAGFLFMMGSGLLLARVRTAAATDALGLLQTLTGAYLAAFLFSHLTSTFLARSRGTNTDWLWATSAPEGLLAGYARLIPHYALAVAFVITHLGCGLRGVMLQHGAAQALADRTAWIIAAGGALLSAAIMAGMFGVRV